VTATWRILEGDCRETLASLDAGSVQTCVTSPPYFGLRDYGHEGQIGLEPSPDEFVAALVAVFRSVRRVLAADGTVWLNLGDSYAQYDGQGNLDEPREPGLHGAFRVAPSLSTVAENRGPGRHSLPPGLKRKYFYDAEAIKEPAEDIGRENGRDGRDEDERARPPGARARTLARLDYTERGRNKRSVWTVATQPYPGAHFATFPPKLIEPCILAGCPEGGTVLDPFAGAGTTGMVALRHGRSFVGCELNADYVRLARDRIIADSPLLNSYAEAA
jgi:DNA modification methylase